MAVVPFPNLPPQGPSAGNPWELRSLTGFNRSPLNAVATSLERAGAHFALRLPYANLATDRRARLQTFGMSCRGSANRFYVPVFGWTRRGSFPAPELFTNTGFDGTTGWLAQSSTLSASDGILRMTGTGNAPSPGARQSPTTLVQYAPYAQRSIIHDGQGTAGLTMGRFFTRGPSDSVSDYSTARGYGVIARVVSSAAPGSQYPIVLAGSTGWIPNITFGELSFASLSRCALVDNGPNLLQQSDNIEHADWTKTKATGSAVAGTAPDGSTDAPALIEDGTAGEHFALQARTRSSAAEDLCAFGYFKRRTGTRNVQLLVDDGSLNGGLGIFDLNAGTVSTATAGTGTNVRAFIVSAGNSWYYCAVVVRCPASASARAVVYLHNTTTPNYTGDSTSSIYCWRVGVARSGVPTRGMQTTTAGDDDGTLQTGGALHLKGLPASTNGLLLQGDPAEIIIGTTSQLVRARASLDSDAAGLGYFQFEPPLRVSPSDNAAVIVCNPLCKMLMENNVAGWTDRMGGFSDLEFAAVEDTYPS